jgi:hypothetical protein
MRLISNSTKTLLFDSILNLKNSFTRLISNKMSNENQQGWKNAKNIYEFSAKDIDGNLVKFDKYRY